MFSVCVGDVYVHVGETALLGEEAELGDFAFFVAGVGTGDALEEILEVGGWDCVWVVVGFEVLADVGDLGGEDVVEHAPVAV